MRGLALVLAVGGLAVLGATWEIGHKAGLPGGPLQMFGMLFVDAGPIAKLAMLALAMGLVAILIVGGIGLAARGRGGRSDALMLMSYLAPGLATPVAVFEGFNIRQAMVATGTTNFLVIAPSVAEVLLLVGGGLFTGAAAAALNAMLPARRKLG